MLLVSSELSGIIPIGLIITCILILTDGMKLLSSSELAISLSVLPLGLEPLLVSLSCSSLDSFLMTSLKTELTGSSIATESGQQREK